MTGINAVVLAGDSKRGSVQEGVDNKSFLSSTETHGGICNRRSAGIPAINEISLPDRQTLKKHLGGKVDLCRRQGSSLR